MKNKHHGVSREPQQMRAAKQRTGAQQRAANRRRAYWLPYGLIGLGALLLIGLFLWSFNPAGAQNAHPLQVGAPMSNFSLNDLQGQKVQLSDYQGNVVLVNAWATWCPPCRAEMPDINAYYQTHHKDGFVVLAVNAGDAKSKAADFAKSNKLAFPVLLDSDLRVLDGLGIHDFPTSIVVGRDGRVKYIQVGMFSPQALDSVVTPLLSK